MKKISLSIDDLRVASFDTEPVAREGRGTVHGQVSRLGCGNTPGFNTCQQGSCGYTCDVLLTGSPCVGC
jgi:hypothetical protein